VPLFTVGDVLLQLSFCPFFQLFRSPKRETCQLLPGSSMIGFKVDVDDM
jgi:hypothetical protein